MNIILRAWNGNVLRFHRLFVKYLVVVVLAYSSYASGALGVHVDNASNTHLHTLTNTEKKSNMMSLIPRVDMVTGKELWLLLLHKEINDNWPIKTGLRHLNVFMWMGGFRGD